MNSIVQSLFAQPILLGLIWSIFALGVFVSFRILNIADMSVEGLFPFSAVITLWAISAGWNPVLALLFAIVLGFLSGVLMGVLNRYLKIDALLAGIILMTAFFSLTVIVSNGNVSLKEGTSTLFSGIEASLQGTLGKSWGAFCGDFIVFGIAVLALYVLVYWFFGTEIGTAIRAVGRNHRFAKAEGLNVDLLTCLGLGIGSTFIAIAGSLYGMWQTSATINLGKGTLVIGLATIFLGEIALPKMSFKAHLASLVLGGYLYWLILSAISLIPGYNANFRYLIQALFITIVMVIPTFRKNIRSLLPSRKEAIHA